MSALTADSTRTATDGRPTPVAATAAQQAQRRGYRRDYEIHPDGGACQLQRVKVHIHYHCGAALLADFRQTYYEFFRFDAQDARLVDTHDFDLVRDGWRQSVILGLTRRHRIPAPRHDGGEPRLTVKKQFTIAPGVVRAAAPEELAPGAWFGMLHNGPCGPSRTTLRVAQADGGWRVLHDLPPCPGSYRVAGSAAFTARRGFRTFELYRHWFANMTGSLRSAGTYTPTAIPTS